MAAKKTAVPEDGPYVEHVKAWRTKSAASKPWTATERPPAGFCRRKVDGKFHGAGSTPSTGRRAGRGASRASARTRAPSAPPRSRRRRPKAEGDQGGHRQASAAAIAAPAHRPRTVPRAAARDGPARRAPRRPPHLEAPVPFIGTCAFGCLPAAAPTGPCGALRAPWEAACPFAPDSPSRCCCRCCAGCFVLKRPPGRWQEIGDGSSANCSSRAAKLLRVQLLESLREVGHRQPTILRRHDSTLLIDRP